MGDLSNKAENVGGKFKEGVGDVTGDDSLKNEGRADQAKADIKDAVSDAGDKVKDVANKVIGSFKKDDPDQKHPGAVN